MRWSWLPRRQGSSPEDGPRKVGQRELADRLQAELAAGEAATKPVTLVYLSVDSHAKVLHRRGLVAAGRLLEAVELILLQESPPEALLASMRRPELTILLPGTPVQDARELIGRWLAAFRTHDVGRVSVGAATSLGPALPAAQLMQQAYQALFEARSDAEHAVHQTLVDGPDSSRPWWPAGQPTSPPHRRTDDPGGGSHPPASTPRPRRTG